MKTKFLTVFLLLIMAAPEAFAIDPGRRGDNIRNGGGNRGGGAARNAPRNSHGREARNAPRNNRGREARNAPRSNRGRDARNAPRNNRGRDARNAPRSTTRRDHRGPVTRRDTHRGNRRPVVRSNARRHRPDRRYYGTERYHRPSNYRARNYSRYYHSPYSRVIPAHRRYGRPVGYYSYMRSNFSTHLYLNWVLSPSSRLNGYYYTNNYPFYIHNGYRHRYSNLETCNYQLVDSYTHSVQTSYFGQLCSSGYNACAYERDSRNDREYANRYFCAETFRDNGYNYNTPTYEYNDQNYYDDQLEYRTDNNYVNNSCFDYDSQSGVCYDN